MPAKVARSQRTASRALAGSRIPVKVGDLLGNKYRVERVIGEGGMGVVVAAHHELLDQRVAVKLLYRDVADREAQSRLLQEARATAKLQSEHVARVLDVDVGQDGLPFIVMELLEGTDLCQLADTQGALPPWLVVDYVLQALEGLAHAHAHAIIHRDLKPSNLFLASRPDGTQQIKILDFGISKFTDGGDRRQQQLTGVRDMLGSPPYMSPEQVRSPKKIDHRSDIWSLGICMYELLTNAMPFGGEEIQETFAQILEKHHTPVRNVVPSIPEGLDAVVNRCLAKNRDERFADVGELAAALAPFGTGAWTQAVERIRATLARGLIEEIAASQRLGTSSGRIALQTPPPPRSDSVQPELHGTARTVAKRGDSRRWLAAGILVPAILGAALIGVSVSRRAPRAAPVQARAPAPAEVAPPPSSEPPAIAVSALAATPAPSESVPAVPVSALASAPRAKASARPAAQRAPAKTASPLPAGLPQTRSGQ